MGGRVEDASVLVRVLAGGTTEADERELRAANVARVPLVAVQTSGESGLYVPYVLASDVVVCPRGAGFPVDEIARVIAARLDLAATPLAARLPVLRDAVCDHLIESFSRKNAILGVAIFVPGADFPVLTLNQIRLVLRLASAHGVEVDQTAPAGDPRHDRRRSRVPRGRAAAPRSGAGGRLGGEGRRRLRGHAGGRRGRATVLRRRRRARNAAHLALSAPACPRDSPGTWPKRRPRCRPVPDLPSASNRPSKGGAMVGTEHAEELLQIEEADAWFEYLEATRVQSEMRYAELEPWAWARLSQRLRAVRARRARLRPAAA